MYKSGCFKEGLWAQKSLKTHLFLSSPSFKQGGGGDGFCATFLKSCIMLQPHDYCNAAGSNLRDPASSTNNKSIKILENINEC
jgi:hypothetical protein